MMLGRMALMAGSSASFLLDTYTGAAAAYSLRQLRTGVTSVVRVRRSSDNTERDFTAEQISDGTLIAWVGAGNNGFIRFWFDQTGNGRHAGITTASAQPSIVSNGVLITQQSRPCINFSGSQLLSHTYTITTPSTISAVCSLTSNAAQGYETIYEATAPSTPLYTAMNADNSNSGKWGTYTNQNVNSIYSAHGFYRHLLLMADGVIAGSTQTTMSTNGNVETFTSTGRYGGDAIDRRYIGGENGNSNYIIGKLQEIVVWPFMQTNNRQAIGSNVNAFYSIY